MDHPGSTRRAVPPAVRQAAAAVRTLPWTSIVLTLVIGITSWPVISRAASIGIDPSWAAALGYALEHGQKFGSDLVFTYGPLGFLAVAWPWFGPLNVPALAFVGVTHFALCAVLVVGARRVVTTWQAAILAYVAARLTVVLFGYEGLLVLVFAACAAVLLRRPALASSWLVGLGGMVTAVGLLGKLNAGVIIAAVVLITTVAVIRPWWRGLLIFVASCSVAIVVLWLGTGQDLVDLPAYVTGSIEIVRGYSEAMGVDRNPGLHWFLLAYALGVLLIARIAVDEAAGLRLTRKAALVLVGVLVAFAFFKTGFVRWNLGYALGAVIVALFAIATGRTARPMFLAVFVAVMLPALAAYQTSPTILFNPVTSARSLVREAATVLRPWTWEGAEERTRIQMRAKYALEPPILDALRGHTVHVDPWQAGVVVAWPELAWRPTPVFQSYSAYTTALDEANAAVLRGPDAPERILRENEAVWPGGTTPIAVAIDHRNRWFDAPAAMLQTFCRYDEVAASARWEVLALTDRRCGAPESLGTIEAAPGQAVTVPVEERQDRFVIARIHGVDDSPLDRLISSLYKSPEWYVTLDAADPYRLVPGTAADGLIMAVPPSIVRAPGFAFGTPVRQLSIAPRTPSAGGGKLTYEFLSVPLEGS